jgi:hypothetical protein
MGLVTLPGWLKRLRDWWRKAAWAADHGSLRSCAKAWLNEEEFQKKKGKKKHRKR